MSGGSGDEEMTLQEALRLSAAHARAARRTGTVKCAVCGAEFTARLAPEGPRYCSGRCRQAALRSKRRGDSASIAEPDGQD